MDDQLEVQPLDAARRRRPLLFTLAALGVVTGLLGGLGVFADVFDRSTTGTNSYEAGDYVELDLQLAMWDSDLEECGPFSDDLTTGLFDIDDDELEAPLVVGKLCARNVGEREGALQASTIDVVDTDVACTGAEAQNDVTCGTGPGELATALTVGYQDCDGPVPVPFGETDLMGATIDVDTLAPGATRVLCLTVVLDDDPMVLRTVQSDRVEWRYAFDLVAEDGDPYCPDNHEHDDETATPLDRNVSLEAAICPGDTDFFTFHHGGGPVSVVLELLAEPSGELKMYLQGPGDYVESENPGGSELISLTNAPPGTYDVGVTGDDIVGANPYRITAVYTAPTCTDDAFEPNDDIESAAPITAGTPLHAVRCGDDDWYVVDIGSPEAPLQFRVTLDDEGPASDALFFFVTDPVLGTGEFGYADGSIEIEGTGRMYIGVLGRFGANSPGYTLSATVLA